MTFPVRVSKLVKNDSGLTDVYLTITGPGPSGSGQTLGVLVVTDIPTVNLAGVSEGNNFSMVIS